MVTGGGSPGGGAPLATFPALDPEPSRSEQARRIIRRAGLMTGILAAAAALTIVLVTVLPGRGAPARPKIQAAAPAWARELGSAAAGFVVSSVPAAGADGPTYAAVSDPDGGRSKTLTALGQLTFGLDAALDNRYFAGAPGEVLSFDAHRQAVIVRRVPGSIPGIGQMFTAFDSPFADGDRDLVLAGNSDGLPAENQILLIPATGKPQALGTGDNVAGDPAASGVFTSVIAPIKPTAQAPPPPGPISADGQVVLRDAGQPARVLATASQLLRALHARQQPVGLDPAPDPAGDKVAIVVQPTASIVATGGGADLSTAPGVTGGIVVLTRAGRVIAALGGLPAGTSPDWSPDGRSFAFVTDGSLRIWTAGGQQTSQKLPPAPRKDSYDACIWSPDGSRILCALTGPKSTGTQWVVAAVSGGPVFRTRGPGYPIAWLR